MPPYYERDGITIHCRDNRDVLPMLAAHTVSAIVTDPPYGLSFVGSDWDKGVPGVHFWEAMLPVMKPGAHLLAFGGTRTFHRMVVAIEDAGYEIRDCLQWIYAMGFPKSLDVSKAIDKAAGAEREVIGMKPRTGGGRAAPSHEGWQRPWMNEDGARDKPFQVTAPATPEAEQWQGWGTALKPAYEPIIMARAPFKGTVAANVMQHGTGAINVDACRIGTDEIGKPRHEENRSTVDGWGMRGASSGDGASHALCRWPANVLLDETTAETAGEWSRFFYVAKASRRERNAGLDGMPQRERSGYEGGAIASAKTPNAPGNRPAPQSNHHPTVKPLALMRYLLTLVTPPGGIVLDPFAGSGSTLVAAAELRFPAIGIEQNEEYAEIAARRVDHALNQRAGRLAW